MPSHDDHDYREPVRRTCSREAPCWKPACSQFWCLLARQERDAAARADRQAAAAKRARNHVTVTAAIGSGPYATAYAVASGGNRHVTISQLHHAPAGTPFAELAEYCLWLAEVSDRDAVATVVLDVTALGAALVKTFTEPLQDSRIRYQRVALAANPVPGVRTIPRLHIVSAVTALLEGEALTLQPGQYASAAVKAMESYRDAPRSMKAPTHGDEWRASQEDEFPLAIGMAAWHLGMRRTAVIATRT